MWIALMMGIAMPILSGVLLFRLQLRKASPNSDMPYMGL
jgi:hypothetical protein